VIIERGEAAYASASWPASNSRRCASSSAVNFLPTAANSVSHIVTYSSIKPGTAGSWMARGPRAAVQLPDDGVV